jgi:hypothetical protein
MIINTSVLGMPIFLGKSFKGTRWTTLYAVCTSFSVVEWLTAMSLIKWRLAASAFGALVLFLLPLGLVKILAIGSEVSISI